MLDPDAGLANVGWVVIAILIVALCVLLKAGII